MRRAFRVAYDGRPYHGFQRQPDVPTVEDAVFDALRALDVLSGDAAKPEGYAAAGRTDAGVSARAQTVAFDAPEWLSPRALNGELPASVRAWASADVDSGFHATHDACSREYAYHLYAPETGGIEDASFDDATARDALARLTGEHDFHNLTPDETGTTRDLSTSAERDGAFFVVRLRAGGFARQLVRRVVGLVAAIGRGDAPLSKVDRVLAPDPLDGPEGVTPAPPEPLILWDVDYPGVTFTVDEDATESAREVFGTQAAEQRIRACVSGAIRESLPHRHKTYSSRPKPADMTEEVKEWWELTARWFQADADLDVGLNWTGLGTDDDLRLLPDVAGKDVLELGCGGGQCSVALARRGGNVIGVDISAAQLSYARDLADEHEASVEFLQGDVTDLGMFPDERFDVAFSAYAFQWVGDLPACFRETQRVLRPGGRFVFSMPHPVYDLADPESHRVEESYFDTGRQVTPQGDLDQDMVTYRHAVSDVYNALVGAGFRVERLLEPGTDDPDEYDAGPWGERTPELLAKLPSTVIFDARAE